MAKSQRTKGANGEREVAKILREHGFDGQRTALLQTHGVRGAADVVGIPGAYLEVKRQERVCMNEWVAQAERDAPEGRVPIVVWRQSRMAWRATLTLGGLMTLCGFVADPARLPWPDDSARPQRVTLDFRDLLAVVPH